MGKFNEELVNAGVMLAGDGLQPSSKGARVRFSGTSAPSSTAHLPRPRNLLPAIGSGSANRNKKPSTGSNAVPTHAGRKSEIEIRQVFEADDFGAEFTAELESRSNECLRKPSNSRRAENDKEEMAQ